MQDQVIQTPEQQACLPKLLGFDFTIEYKQGKDISHVFFSTSSQQFEFLNTLHQELKHYDPLLDIPAATIDSNSLVKQDGLWF